MTRFPLSLAAFAFLVLLTAPVKADNRPNIVYIMSDDHAAHFVTGKGLGLLKTPHIDRLAAGGMTFNRAFCTNALCGPARAVVLTGKYSHANGFTKNGDSFDADQPTFPKMLQKAGYQTGIFGKWHLKSTPQGFDEFLVLPGQGKYFDPTFYSTDSPTKTIQIQGYCTDITTSKALEWLDGRDTSRPFMVMIHNKAPHGPWDPAPRHRGLYADMDIPHPPTFDIKETAAQAMSKSHMVDMYDRMNRMKKPKPEGALDELGWKNWHYQWYSKDYMRTLQSVDDNVGRVLDWLEQNNLADNTLVIYSSDNGMFVGDRGLFDKRLMYEPALRLPLYIKFPKSIPAGATTDALALNVDFAPTMLDFAGVKIPKDMQGKSLKAVTNGQTPDDWRDHIY
ncbi:MAG: sulfatase family protein, partial [Planctomycetota bacterium]